MRILVVHNAYKHRGGEDTVVESEIDLLRSMQHPVATYFRSNDDVDQLSPLALLRNTLWSRRTQSDLAEVFASFQPDVIHAHNTFPLISPSLYWAADRAGIPVVQTLHNFRLMCLNALFLRNGKVCEDCMGKVPWRGVARACYRESRPASLVLAGMLTMHRELGTYRHKVARYIALNEFCRRKFIEGGLPPERIAVKPNFVDFPIPEVAARSGLLFVGRLSMEKGIATLAKAATLVADVQMRVAGDGPESGLLDDTNGLTKLGRLSADEVRHEMCRASALVVPSIWYENFPRTIVEAFACGLPVIASNIGALADIVHDGTTGLLFAPGDPRALAEKMEWAQAHPEQMAVMGQNARTRYEAEYSAEANYRRLIQIYSEALSEQGDGKV